MEENTDEEIIEVYNIKTFKFCKISVKLSRHYECIWLKPN